MITFYELLGIRPDTPIKEIEKRYHLLCRKLHPDLNPDVTEGGAEYFKQIQEAYDILSDAEKREKYDKKLEQERRNSEPQFPSTDGATPDDRDGQSEFESSQPLDSDTTPWDESVEPFPTSSPYDDRRTGDDDGSNWTRASYDEPVPSGTWKGPRKSFGWPLPSAASDDQAWIWIAVAAAVVVAVVTIAGVIVATIMRPPYSPDTSGDTARNEAPVADSQARDAMAQDSPSVRSSPSETIDVVEPLGPAEDARDATSNAPFPDAVANPSEGPASAPNVTTHLTTDREPVPVLKPVISSSQLLERAHRDFNRGRERSGLARLYASALLGDQDVRWSTLFRWCPALERPVTALRLGLAVQIVNPDDRRWATAIVELDGSSKAGSKIRKPNQISDFHERNEAFGKQMHDLWGHLGNYLIDDLQAWIDNGHFGDWGNEPTRDPSNLRRLTLLGVGTDDEMYVEAQRKNIDLLMLASWEYRPIQLGWDARIGLRIVDPHKVRREMVIWQSARTVLKESCDEALRQGELNDAAQQLFVALHQYLGDEVTLTDVPRNARPQLQRRAARLSDASSNPSLAKFAELRFYREIEILSESELLAAYQKLVRGNDGHVLLHGSLIERAELLERFLGAD